VESADKISKYIIKSSDIEAMKKINTENCGNKLNLLKGWTALTSVQDTIPIIEGLRLQKDTSKIVKDTIYLNLSITEIDWANCTNKFKCSGTMYNFNLLDSLKVLKLSGHNISDISALNIKKLNVLNLSNNQLTGEIPSINNSNLSYYNLSGNKFSSLKSPIMLPNCYYYDVSNNQITGKFPKVNLPKSCELRINDNEINELDTSIYIYTKGSVQMNRLTFEEIDKFRITRYEYMKDNFISRFPQKPINQLIYDQVNNRVICNVKADKYIWQMKNNNRIQFDSCVNYLDLNQGYLISDLEYCNARKEYDVYSFDFYFYSSEEKLKVVFANNPYSGLTCDSSEINYLNSYFKQYYEKDTANWQGWPIKIPHIDTNTSIANIGFAIVKNSEGAMQAKVNALSFKHVFISEFDYEKFKNLSVVCFDSCAVNTNALYKLKKLKGITLRNLTTRYFDDPIEEIYSDSLNSLIIENTDLDNIIHPLNTKYLRTLILSNVNITKIELDFKKTYLRTFIIKNVGVKFDISNFNFDSLQYMDISGNSVYGEIPAIKSEKLSYLDISNNKISGELPMIDCPKLIIANLSNNMFTGELSQFNSPKLVELILKGNFGELTMADSLSYPRLGYFNISNSNFIGKFGILLGQQMMIADLSNNKFDILSYFYYWIDRASFLYFDASHNNFNGEIPRVYADMCEPGKDDMSLYVYDFSYNNFTVFYNTSSFNTVLSTAHNKLIYENQIPNNFKIPWQESTRDFSNPYPQDTCYNMFFNKNTSSLMVDSRLDSNVYEWLLDDVVVQKSYSNTYKLSDKSQIDRIKCRVYNANRHAYLIIDAIYKGDISTAVVAEESLSASISICPNPAQDYIQIDLQTNTAENISFTVYNELGVRVLETSSKRIDISSLANGHYRLIADAGDRHIVKSFVVSR
jgi:hypothetical protein